MRNSVFLDSHGVGVDGVVVFLLPLLAASFFLAALEFVFRFFGRSIFWVAICVNNALMVFLYLSYFAFGVLDLSGFYLFFVGVGTYFLVGYVSVFLFSYSFRYFVFFVIIFLFLFFIFFWIRSSSVLLSRASAVSPKHSLVFLVFDEFPLKTILDSDGEIARDKFPNFFELSQCATWFKNATTVAWETQLSVPSMVTGRYPEFSGNFNIYEHNLFKLVDPNAVSHYVVEPILKLSPIYFKRNGQGGFRATLKNYLQFFADSFVVYAHLVSPNFFRIRFPSIDHSWFGYVDLTWVRDILFSRNYKADGAVHSGSDLRKDQYFDYISQIQKASSPIFHFVHVMLPHRPWVYDEQGGSIPYGGYASDLVGDVWTADHVEVSRFFTLHERQVQFVDYLVGRTLTELKEKKLFDDSMIVITSDHGASFLPGGQRRMPTTYNLLDIARVPLFIKFPEQKVGSLSEVDVQLIDVLPTIVDVLNLSPNWKVHGRSLVNAPSLASKNRKLYGKGGEIFEFSLE